MNPHLPGRLPEGRKKMVPVVGVEPTWSLSDRGILSPVRLPIPPHRHRPCQIYEVRSGLQREIRFGTSTFSEGMKKSCIVIASYPFPALPLSADGGM